MNKKKEIKNCDYRISPTQLCKAWYAVRYARVYESSNNHRVNRVYRRILFSLSPHRPRRRNFCPRKPQKELSAPSWASYIFLLPQCSWSPVLFPLSRDMYRARHARKVPRVLARNDKNPNWLSATLNPTIRRVKEARVERITDHTEIRLRRITKNWPWLFQFLENWRIDARIRT